MTRSEQREEAFKVVFESLFVEQEKCENEQQEEFSESLINAVKENKTSFMELIKNNLKTDSAKVYMVDLAIMLVAIADVKNMETPVAVAVYEAVELAKK